MVTIYIDRYMNLMLMSLRVNQFGVGGKDVSGAISRAVLSRTVVCRIIESGCAVV